MHALLAALEPPHLTRWIVLGALVLAAGAIVFAATRTSDDPCEEAAARIAAHWNTGIEAVTRARFANDAFAVDDLATLSSFAERWPELRRQACRDERTDQRELAERRATCLDKALGGFDRAIASPPWRSRKGETWMRLPSLARCAGDFPDRAPIVHPIGGSLHDPTSSFALGPGGDRVAVLHAGYFQILSERGGERSIELPAALRDGSLVRWKSPHELGVQTASGLSIIDPETGQETASHAIAGNAVVFSRDLERALIVTGDGWEILTVATGVRTPVPGARGLECSQAAWSPDGLRIAAICVPSEAIDDTLRLLDLSTLRVVDQPFRIDTLTSDAFDWLDSRRLAFKSRISSDHGEEIAVATIDDQGRVVDVESRLAAPIGSEYGIADIAHGRALAGVSSSRTQVARIHKGTVTPLASTIDAYWVMGIDPDGKRLAIASDQTSGLVSMETGQFTSTAVPRRRPVAIARGGRLITIDDTSVLEVDDRGAKRVVAALPITHNIEHLVNCSFGGTTCILLSRTKASTELRTVTSSGLGPPRPLPFWVADLAIAPDGHSLAASGAGHVTLLDLGTSQLRTATASSEACPQPQGLSWSTDGRRLYASAACKPGGRSRIMEVDLAGGPPRVVYDADAWIGRFVTGPDGSFYSVLRRWDYQLMLVDGL